MRIGIVSPVVLFHDFAKYFEGNEKDILLNLQQNSNGPAPSIIAQGFINAGHFVRFFTVGPENRIFRSKTIEIVTINTVSGLRKYVKLNEFKGAYYFAKEMKPYISDLDVLHAHWTYFTAMAAGHFAKRIPVFCTVRDWTSVIRGYLPNKGGYQWFIRQIVNDINFRNHYIHFIGNSPYTKSLIDAKLNKDVPCIMNPIDDKFIIQGEKSYSTKLKIICITSSVDERKNIKVLLSAYKRLKEMIPSSQLTCIFGYPSTLDSNPYYQEWKRDNLLNDVIVLKGLPHEEIIHYIDESTVMVNPSLEETFGNTIIESMARKTPVIAGRHSGAIPYLIDNDSRGFLCDVSSVESLLSTILEAYNNPKDMKLRADNAFDWIIKNNTLEAITRAHISYYLRYVNKNDLGNNL